MTLNKGNGDKDLFEDQVREWVHKRLEVRRGEKVLFSSLYQDYRDFVSATTRQHILDRLSFSRNLNIVLEDCIKSGVVLKVKRHPVRFENLKLQDYERSTVVNNKFLTTGSFIKQLTAE